MKWEIVKMDDDEILAKIKEVIGERIGLAPGFVTGEGNWVIHMYLLLSIIQRLDTIDQSLGSLYSELNEIESAINRN
jgi:hypothetical protein